MAEVFKIIDRFKLTGRGTVYALKVNKGVILKVGDLLFDFRGNKFKVTGIEMPTRCWDYLPPAEELPIGILVELVSGIEAEGDVLFRNFTDKDLLVK